MKKLPGDVYPNQPPGDGWNSRGLGSLEGWGCLMRIKTLKRQRTLRTCWKNSKGVLISDTKIAHVWDLCYLICVICFWHFVTSFESDQFSLIYVLWEVCCTKTLGHSVPVASNFELVGPETFAGSGSGLGGFAAGCLWRRLAKSGDLSQSFSSLLACVLSWESN